ncbi:hypothetical protein LPJ61_006077 [Coemansia biformis]|uniref:Uncharacterized protein n=1 Tax=Coemansia biformis TaxID=1286918 RepID=A0A9W8CRS3_9FUNG|nr:hypothetical protein LPJ61_006077 [Coemansia biformis]
MSETYLLKVTFSRALSVSIDHVVIHVGMGDNPVRITQEINKMLATYGCAPLSDLSFKIANTSSGRSKLVSGYQTLLSVGFAPKKDPSNMVNTAIAYRASEARSSDCLIL